MSFNLPDGISVNDLPGFRRSDDEIEELVDYAEECCGQKPSSQVIDHIIDTYQALGYREAMWFVEGLEEKP